MKKIDYDYKRLYPFKWFILENFPFIEADFDAITNWQLFCKLGKEMNKVINSVNMTGEQVELLTNAFNQLQEYVTNYFENLDVQEEINNKLDEMAEGGELANIIAEFIEMQGLLLYDNVNEMKQSTNLRNGSFAKTYGFYSINDGGKAFYKVREKQENEVPNNITVIQLSDASLVAELVTDKVLDVKQFGAKGDGTSNDTVSIQTALTFASNLGKKLVFSKGVYLVDSSLIINNENNDVIIEGDSAIISLSGTESGYRLFDITAKNVKIDNIKIDGNLTNQNQFEITDYSALKIYTACRLTGNNITINNIKVENIYGNAFQFFKYQNINISNISISNVGGHFYLNNDYDSFGDAFYFGGHEGTSNISIENVNSIGKYNNTTLSRIGICVENLLNNIIDEKTIINVNNCNLINYDRGIHCESIRGVCEIVYTSGKIYSNVSVLNWSDDENKLKFYGNNILFDYADGNYNGSYGIRRTIIDIKNSVVNCKTQSLGSYRTKGKYSNCVFNNIIRTMFNSAGHIDIENSVANIGSLSTYLCYSSDIHWNNCTFISDTDINESKSSTSMYYKSCTFNKFIPHYIAENLKNEIYMSNSYSYTATNKRDLQSAKLYLDTTHISNPNMSQTFPIENIDLYKYFGYRQIPSDSTIQFFPTFDGILLRPNSKYLLLSLGTNDWTHLYTGRTFTNYYYNIITTDNSGNITIAETQTVGNPTTGGYGLSIDYINNTVGRSGNYSSIVCQWLLPYFYRDYLPNFPV